MLLSLLMITSKHMLILSEDNSYNKGDSFTIITVSTDPFCMTSASPYPRSGTPYKKIKSKMKGYIFLM